VRGMARWSMAPIKTTHATTTNPIIKPKNVVIQRNSKLLMICPQSFETLQVF